MASRWKTPTHITLATRLGQLTMRAHGVIAAQRVQSIHRMLQVQTKTLRELPGAKRCFAEAQRHLDQLSQQLKDPMDYGE